VFAEAAGRTTPVATGPANLAGYRRGAAAPATLLAIHPTWGDLSDQLKTVPVTTVLQLCGVALVVILAVAVLRHVMTRYGLKTRVVYELLPDSSFDPTPEQVRLVSAQLARARRAVSLLPRRATALRVTLAGDHDGLLRYRMSVPWYAEPVLRSATWPAVSVVEPGFVAPGVPSFGSLRDVVEEDHGGSAPQPGRLHVARAELTLARDDAYPLKDRGLDPDPLEAFARLMGNLDGDRVAVHFDLSPVNHARERWWRRRATNRTEDQQRRRDEAAESRAAGGMWASALEGAGVNTRRTVGGGFSRLRRSGILAAEMRVQTKAVGDKVFSTDPLWQVQVLIRVESWSKARAKGHLQAVLSACEQFSGENYWRVVGINAGRGWFDGADSWWRRWWFDYRCRTGLFAPRRTRRVRTGEVLGLLKPPTTRCGCETTSRMPALPAPPDEVPTYRGPADTPDLLPQGFARTPTGWRPVGTALSDSLFQLNVGRAEYGKSERAIVQAVHLANAGGVGLMFLDPHADAIERMRPYLGAVADRVVEVNLSVDTGTQGGWNPLSMTGRGRGEVEERVGAVVNSFSAALGWGQVNNRAQTLTQMAAQSLCELGLQLPAELQPTIFQMTTILSNEDWRGPVLPFLSGATRDFWDVRFDRLSKDAITPVTNLLDRLRASDRIAALFGSPQSTYDVRRAMDEGKIVLACPSGTGDKDRLITAIFLNDLLRAALSRRDIPPGRRRPFWLFADEIQQYSTRDLAHMLEQTRKFGLRVAAATQSVERLPDWLREAFLTNASHLITTAASADSARMIARQWGNAVPPEAIIALAKYTALGTFRVRGNTTPPFFVHGIEIGDAYAHLYDETAPEQIADAVDVNLARRPIRDTLDELRTLDERILQWLLANRGGRGRTPPQPAGPPTRPASTGPHAAVVPLRRRRPTRFG